MKRWSEVDDARLLEATAAGNEEAFVEPGKGPRGRQRT
jgi:hypothetical protein